MTKYFTLNVKSMLTHPELLFWSIAFIEFWVLMWAYVFGAYVPKVEEAVRTYTAQAYGSLLTLSLSATAVGITEGFLHSSRSIKFVTKYTRLSPSRFMAEHTASSMLVLSVVAAVMYASIAGVFAHKFGMYTPPVKPLQLTAVTALGCLFMYAISAFLSLAVVVLRAPRSARFVSYIPLILGFLAYGALWLDFKAAAYISPFNCILALCIYYYSGVKPTTGAFVMGGGAEMDMGLTLLSLVCWVAALIALNVLLLRKMRGVGVEEIRVV